MLPALAQPPAAAPPSDVQPLDAVARRAEAAVRAALPRAGGPAPRHDPARPSPQEAPAGPDTVRIVARPLDPRLRLARCGTLLEAEVTTSATGIGPRAVVMVRCVGPNRWSVLVPVHVETEATVLVATRALPRGALPGPGDLQAVRRNLPGITNIYISNLEMIEGHHLSRPVAPGMPLTRAMLAAHPVVRRGESVTLVARHGGLEIRAPGRALADAAPGDPVRVQNVNSLKVVEGRADNTGMIRVDP